MPASDDTPRYAEVLAARGLGLVSRGEIERGHQVCLASMLLLPTVQRCTEFTQAFFALYDFDRALPFTLEGLKHAPDNVYLNYTAGVGLCWANRLEEALERLDRAHAAKPAAYQPLLSRGFVLKLLGRSDDAIESYRTALAGEMPDGEREDATNNLAGAYITKGMPQQALSTLEDACPNSPTGKTVYNKSLIHLGTGNWPLAWKMFRARHQLKIDGRYLLPQIGVKRADTLDDVRGKSVLLYHEQGYGDTIQFLRYAPLLRAVASDLTIWLPPELVRLARFLANDHSFTIAAQGSSRCDVAVAMMDLPALFDTTIQTIPSHRYLRPIPTATTAHNRLRIGLCWRGQKRSDDISAEMVNERRSMDFDGIGHIVSRLSGAADFVSLQRVCEHRAPPYYRKLVAEPIADDFDFLDTASVVAGLDLVISVDTAVAHLAATLGKPVWLMSRHDGCWRWFYDDRTDSPWYPTLKLYRQPEPHDWVTVINRVAHDLQDLLEAI